jgi:ribosomal protein S18 acetylase RimI-like enzyme
MRYRHYQSGDFAALYAIEEICFEPPHRFSRRYMRDLVEGANAATWVAEEDGILTGFAIVDWALESGKILAYIQTIEVAPEWRGRKIGHELLRRIEDSARGAGAGVIWLHVDAANEPAIRLYESQSYRRQRVQEHYYGRGRAALVYAKVLDRGNGTV